jgi:hypothetical protein
VWTAGLAVEPFLDGVTEPQIIIVRLLVVGALGLFAGAVAAPYHSPVEAATRGVR